MSTPWRAVNLTNPELNYYLFNISVTDPGGLSSMAEVLFYLSDTNVAPVVAGGSASIAENSPPGVRIILVNVSDGNPPDHETRSMTGDLVDVSGLPMFNLSLTTVDRVWSLLTGSGNLDFETMPVLNLKITATDDGHPPMSGFGLFTINVVDVNEKPSFWSNLTLAASVKENVASATYLLTMQASDPDVFDIGRLRYSWSNPATNAQGVNVFAIDPVSGVLATFGSIDYEYQPSYTLTLVVTDGGQSRTPSVPALTDVASVAVAIINVNEPPVLASGLRFDTYESWGRGRAVGNVTATDPDAGTVFSFAIVSGNIGAAFVLDVASGLITVSYDGALDYENVVTYNLTISVTDNGVPGDGHLLTAFGSVIINVLNVNDVTVSSFAGTTTLPTAGGGVTYIYGSNLGRIAALPDGTWGPAASVSYGHFGDNGTLYMLAQRPDYLAPELLQPGQCSRASSTLIYCSVGIGSGKDFLFRVTVGSDTTLTQAPLTLSYAVPVISNIWGAEGMPTNGGSVVNINGTSFGPLANIVVNYGPPRDPLRYTAVNCTVASFDTLLRCRRSVPLAVRALGQGLTISVLS